MSRGATAASRHHFGCRRLTGGLLRFQAGLAGPGWTGPAAGSLISPACFPSGASFPFFHGAVPVGLVPGMGY